MGVFAAWLRVVSRPAPAPDRRRRRSAPLPARRWEEDAIGGAEDRREAQVNQIDSRDAERDVPVKHHAFVQKMIEEVEDRLFGLVEDLVRDGKCSRRRSLERGRDASSHYPQS
jgi:hypothetical protein